jgi:transposase
MYVAEIPNRGRKPTILLRESYREGGKVKNRTLANLSKLPPHALEALQRVLQGEMLVPASEAFEIERSLQHGHVEAVLTAIRRLGLDRIISSRRCRERDLVLGMVAARVLGPSSKLNTTRWWKTTTLPETLGIEDASEDELYRAMDWLLDRQASIETKLATKHLEPCGIVLYDVSSTWVEGEKCPLASRGYSRDGKKDKLQINFGLLTDDAGRPISVSVYPGRTADPSTVQDQVRKLKEEYGLDLVVFVGDRGMVTQTQIDAFIKQDGVEWITALKSGSIRRIRAEGSLQLGLFDQKNLFEFESQLYPGERLVACRNEELARRRASKRQSLIDATKKELTKIQTSIRAGRLVGKDAIGVRVGRIINKYKVAKHFKLEIGAASLHYRVRQDNVAAEAALDGIYIIRSSVPADAMSAEDTVRHYKRLTRVEKAFRSMKTVDLLVRPIYHYAENRVRAHILLCMLAYYVEWHLREAWSSLLFANEVDTLDERDPVAKAKPTNVGQRKAASKLNTEGLPVHKFRSLLDHLASVVRNYCRRPGAPEGETFDMTTRLDTVQTRALQLVDTL